MIEFEDLTFLYKGRIGKRRCYRVYHKDLFVLIKLNKNNKKRLFKVKNISTYGVAFIADKDKDKFYKGQILYLSIIFKKEIILKHLKAKVKRIHKEENIIACEFLDHTKEQEYILDRLCLLIQKEHLNTKRRTSKWLEVTIK